MTDKDKELALQYVEKWLKAKKYFSKEARALDVTMRGAYIDVAMLEPYGLFIIHPNGQVEDNYEVFEKRK